MLLAIDIGNSHTVIGLFDGNNLLHSWRIRTEPTLTADEIAASVFSLIAMHSINFSQISGAVIACVVPQLNESWLAFTKTIVSSPLLVSSSTTTGITICTDTPNEVGADRIVNSVAGFNRYRCPLIIVDFGTAITFDCVSPTGEYLGGAICPGVAISLESLGKKTAKLPQVNLSTPPIKPIGTNTIAAIQSGVLYGFGGLTEGLIKRLKDQIAHKSTLVLATGGMAQLIAPYAPSIDKIEPELTMQGLYLIHEQNR